MARVVKNPSANAGDPRDADSISGSETSLGGGHGNPLQYSCLENPINRGAWRSIAHGVPKSQTRLKQLSTHSCTLRLEYEGVFYSSIQERDAVA